MLLKSLMTGWLDDCFRDKLSTLDSMTDHCVANARNLGITCLGDIKGNNGKAKSRSSFGVRTLKIIGLRLIVKKKISWRDLILGP